MIRSIKIQQITQMQTPAKDLALTNLA